MSEYGVTLFHTTSSAMAAEKTLIKEGFSIKLIPTPRQFSSDCGISLRFRWENRPDVETILQRGNIDYEAILQL